MGLVPVPLVINFSRGLETKTDPKQIEAGQFLVLDNMVFDTGGLLQKRNGYGQLPELPNNNFTYLTTFKGDLTAIGTGLESFSSSAIQWFSQQQNGQGAFQAVQLNVLPLVRNNTNQSQCDSAVTAAGLICTVYIDQLESSLSTPVTRYVVSDSVTGQIIIEPTNLPSASTDFPSARVFVVGNYFVILYTESTTALFMLAIDTTNLTAPPVNTLVTSYTPSTTVAFDADVYNNTLYVAYNRITTAGMQARTISSSLVISAATTIDSSHKGSLVTVSADTINNIIWIAYLDGFAGGTNNGYGLTVLPNLTIVTAVTQIITNEGAANLTCRAGTIEGTQFIYEISNAYGYDANIQTDYLKRISWVFNMSPSSPVIIARSVGLASKAFLPNSGALVGFTVYFLVTYDSRAVTGMAGSYSYSQGYQPSYFLMDYNGNVIAKLAYSNGGGYLNQGLPGVSINGLVVYIPYLNKDLVQAVNKNTNVPTGQQTLGIYSQTGINLATIEIGGQLVSAEIGDNLNITGGFLWGYDGYYPVESNFFLWPDSVECTWSASGGSMAAQPDGSTNTNAYFYQVTYEWTDNQGNAFKSAPSIPVAVTTSGSGSSGSVTINVPTLRLTYKTANPVKIVVYRWSVGQQIYYQTTSITAPILNDPTIDYVSIPDTSGDPTILGNNIIYTNGGVAENIGPPACTVNTLFDDRLWLVDAEDQNLLWFSKQVIEGTPVETSDLFTVYVAPSISAQGPTGVIKCISPMDDKLIIFKGTMTNSSAIYYINGTGPDNTGANNQYSQPIFVTSTVGCSNQKSIVFMPNGLMFEYDSPAGNQIWLLGRDLTTTFIGAPVQALTSDATVGSAVNIPGQNEVRFTMSTGITIVYNYFYNQWSTFSGVSAASSTIYQGLHTYIDNSGDVAQETPGVYLDFDNPILMSFVTGWIKLQGVSGYQRLLEIQLLGEYLSPHLLNIQLAYDFLPDTEVALITPTNNNVSGTPEQWRIQQSNQKCQAFQISLNEQYDSSFSVPSGAGFTLSGMTCTIGVNRGYRPVKATNTTGTTP